MYPASLCVTILGFLLNLDGKMAYNTLKLLFNPAKLRVCSVTPQSFRQTHPHIVMKSLSLPNRIRCIIQRRALTAKRVRSLLVGAQTPVNSGITTLAAHFRPSMASATV